MILYVLLYDRLPFDSRKRLLPSDFTFSEDICVSENCKDLITKIIVLDQNERLSFEQFLQEPFVTEFSEETLLE